MTTMEFRAAAEPGARTVGSLAESVTKKYDGPSCFPAYVKITLTSLGLDACYSTSLGWSKQNQVFTGGVVLWSSVTPLHEHG